MSSDKGAPNRIDFGKLKSTQKQNRLKPEPPPSEAVKKRKRSLIVGLIALGAGSIAVATALTPRKTCEERRLANPNDPCATSSGRSSSSTHWLFSSGSGSSSTPATSHAPSSGVAGKSAVSHGGFGSTGSHFSSHGS